MSVIIETEKTVERFKSQIVKLKEILEKYKIDSIKKLVKSVSQKSAMTEEIIKRKLNFILYDDVKDFSPLLGYPLKENAE